MVEMKEVLWDVHRHLCLYVPGPVTGLGVVDESFVQIGSIASAIERAQSGDYGGALPATSASLKMLVVP